MKSCLRNSLLLMCLTVGGLAQVTPPIRRVPIGSLLIGFKGKPFAEVQMFDKDHLLVKLRRDCSKDKANCFSNDQYAVVDLAGNPIARITVPASTFLLPMLDGHILLDEKRNLKVLDASLASTATYSCVSDDCAEKAKYAEHGGRRICFTEDPQSCHLFDAVGEVAADWLGGPTKNPNGLENPLLAEARGHRASVAIVIGPDEVWYLGEKSRIFSLVKGAQPVQIAAWAPFFKENCGMSLSTGNNPRVIASCSVGLEIDFDDGIPLFDQTIVLDVHTRKKILERKEMPDTGSSLSPDGHTLVTVGRNSKFVNLEVLP